MAQESGLLHGVIHALRIEQAGLTVGPALRIRPSPAFGGERRPRRIILRDSMPQDLSAQHEIAHAFDHKRAQ